MWIVLIAKDENVGLGLAHPCAFTGIDKDKLIKRAIKKRDDMEKLANHVSEYTIYVGVLTHRIDNEDSATSQERADTGGQQSTER